MLFVLAILPAAMPLTKHTDVSQELLMPILLLAPSRD